MTLLDPRFICMKMFIYLAVNILMQLHCLSVEHKQEKRLVCKAHLNFHSNFFSIF